MGKLMIAFLGNKHVLILETSDLSSIMRSNPLRWSWTSVRVLATNHKFTPSAVSSQNQQPVYLQKGKQHDLSCISALTSLALKRPSKDLPCTMTCSNRGCLGLQTTPVGLQWQSLWRLRDAGKSDQLADGKINDSLFLATFIPIPRGLGTWSDPLHSTSQSA